VAPGDEHRGNSQGQGKVADYNGLHLSAAQAVTLGLSKCEVRTMSLKDASDGLYLGMQPPARYVAILGMVLTAAAQEGTVGFKRWEYRYAFEMCRRVN
jgi:hypothetical protein